MTDEFRIQELLEEILESGLTPQEVCAACPELLPVVEMRLRQIRQLEKSIDKLFPSPTPRGSQTQQPSDPDKMSQSTGEPRSSRGASRPVRNAMWERPKWVAAVVAILFFLAIVGAILMATIR